MTASFELIPSLHLLVSNLTEQEYSINEKLRNDLLEKQEELTSQRGFLVGGKFYYPGGYSPKYIRTVPKGPVHPDLADEALRMHNVNEDLRKETTALTTSLRMLLVSTTSFQDMRDALPDIVQEFHPELVELKRTRPEAYPFLHAPMRMNTYKNTTLRLIHFFLSSRMLY